MGKRKRQRRPTFTMRLVGALGGLVILVALLAGVPLALLLLAGNPIPESVPTLDQITDLVTSRDLDGSLFLTAVAYLGWLGWASFAVSVLLEAVAAVSGRRMPRIRGLRAQQRAAAALIGLVLAVMAGPGTAAVADAGDGEAVAAASDATELDDDPASPTPATTQAPAPYTVQPGDSLWRIAEQRLGDGALWPEIAEINYGTPQLGVSRGLDDSHVIHPGWVLEIPPADVDPDDDGREAHIVVRGDTLWDIAEDHLEPPTSDAEIAAEWPRWYDANREVIGDDPDLIFPGQRLVHPDSDSGGAEAQRSDDSPSDGDDGDDGDDGPAARGATPAAAPSESGTASPLPPAETDEAGTPTSAPDAGSAGELAEPGTGSEDTALPVLPNVTASPTPAADAGDDGSDAVPQGLPVRTVAGIGALLAAALTALVAVGRRRQHAKRRRGEQIPAPDERTAHTEQEIWSIADQVGAEMLDRALRNLAGNAGSLPQVRAARLTPHAVELYLTTPMQLPHPWQGNANATVWSLPADALQHIEPVGQDVPAPYPCLVTTGHDEEGGHVLVDLEQIRALGVDGPHEQAQQIITALAIELACSPLADDLSVSVIGACQEIGNVLGTGRLQYVDDLDSLLDTLEAHARSDGEALRRLGAKTAAQARPHAGEWTPDVVLIADPLTDHQRQRLTHLIHGAPRLAIAAITTGAGGLTDWVLRCDVEKDPESWMLEPVGLEIEPQRIASADYDNIVEILRATDRRPEPRDDPGPAVEPTTPADVPDPAGDGPLIKVLGPVTLERARGNVDRSHIGQLTEIAAYIAVHPGTASEDLDNAIWPGEPRKGTSRAQACSRLRNWLGSDDDGERYFPQMADGHYRFTPAVRTDWDLFRALVPADPATVPTGNLEAALGLVTGQPFTGATGRRPKYRWADRLKSEMIIAITDAAALVAERALEASRPAQARAAAETGLQAEPGMEQLWRLLLRAEHQAGNLDGVQAAVDRLELQLEDIGSDPEPETTELIEELLPTSRRHLAV